MIDHIKDAAEKHPRAVTALKVCFFAALAFLFMKLVIGSKEMEPNALRGFLIGIRGIGAVLLGSLGAALDDWYETLPWFAFFVNVLYISPFVGLLASLFVLFDGRQLLGKIHIPRFPALMKKRRKPVKTNDRQNDKPHSRPLKPPFFPPAPSPIDRWLEQKYRQSNALHQALVNTGDSNPYAVSKPLVRVQSFSSTSQREYMITWADWGGAVISLGSTHEILMNLSNDEKTGQLIPHIVGCVDTAGVRTEKKFPLVKDVPLCIYRQGDSQVIRRFVITWIGGENDD